MKGTRYKITFELIKKTFIGLLTGILSESNHTKWVLLSNHPNLINLHPNKYSQEFHYHPFSVNRCVGSSNTLNDLSNKVCIPNKTEDSSIHVFNMITGKNEPKLLTKDISCKFKYKFDGRKCNSNQEWNNDKCRCECEKHICEKDHIWNPATCICENAKYLASFIDDDSVIMCDEITEETKTIPTNFNKKSNL